MKKNVTIVVPVYGDLDSLSQCIESLKTHVADNHTVMFVNDCGPEADLLEKAIKNSIKIKNNFLYFRNPKNLGFIGTCNRAALELDMSGNDVLLLNSDTIVTEGFLDEMVGVLYSNEHHGAVCPRSSNATIASVPFRFSSPRDERETDVAWDVYQNVKELLPRYTVAPVAVGFAILVKRQLIDNYGLFDPQYGLGYSEENDFCLRINQYGYSSVIANHAFVYHLESKSFTSEKKRILVENNENLMVERFPFYRDLVKRYVDGYIDPIDWFADIIGRKQKTKVLINLFHLPASFNGTSRNALSFLAYVSNLKNKNIEFTILAQKDATTYHRLDKFNLSIIHPEDEQDQTFHIGYVPSQIFHLQNLIILNKLCLKIVVSDLDIIGVRSNYLLANSFDLRAIYFDSFRYANGIVAISKATVDDTIAYYSDDRIIKSKFKIISQGFPGNTFDDETSPQEDHLIPQSILESKYIFIIGNRYKHKVIKETLRALKESSNTTTIISFGMKIRGKVDGLYSVESGQVSDAFIEKLMTNASVVVFPSVYEGFGLPIAEAAQYGKPIVLADTQVSREVVGLYGGSLRAYYYSSFDEIPGLVEKAIIGSSSMSSKKPPIRTLDDYNKEVVSYLSFITEQPTNPEELRNRWTYFTHVNEYTKSAPTLRKSLRVKTTDVLRAKMPKAYSKLRTTYRTYIKK